MHSCLAFLPLAVLIATGSFADAVSEVSIEMLQSQLQVNSTALKHVGLAMVPGSPTQFPWSKKCTEGEKKAYVDAVRGKNWKRGGEYDKPLKTIQYAVDKYKGTCTTIYIKAGTYYNQGFERKNKNNPNKVVNLNGVTDLIIRNYGSDHVLIKFNGAGGFLGGSLNDPSTAVKDVEIYGFEIEGPNQDITYAEAMADRPKGSKYFSGRGIAIFKGERIHLHNLKVHDTPGGGLRVDNGDYVVIESNEVYRCTWWANSAESAVVLAQSVNIDTEEGIKMILRSNTVYENMNRIPYYNKNYKWDTSPIGDYNCAKEAGCFEENTNGCHNSGCICPWQCRYGKISQDYIVDGSGVYVTRNSDTYKHGQMELTGNTAYSNGINGLVFHRTFRGWVEKNMISDNGQVPKDGHDEDIKMRTDWMKNLKKTRQPYSGLVLNNADEVQVWGNIVRARYDDDFAFALENDAGKSYKPAAGGNNTACKGKINDDFESYAVHGTAAICANLTALAPPTWLYI